MTRTSTTGWARLHRRGLSPHAAPAGQSVEKIPAEVERYARGGPHDDARVLMVLRVT